MQYIDIHCHILPDLDDGAEQDEETFQMAEMAASDCTAGIVCTPHRIPDFDYTFPQLKSVFLDIVSKLKEYGIPVKLYPGQEIFLTDNMSEIIRDLETGVIFTLNRSQYPLVEFDPYEKAEEAFRKLGQLIAHGYVPIVAHPERYAFINEAPDAAWVLRDMGALLQINKGSLHGFFGYKAAETVHYLLEERLADFIASDAHSPHIRTPLLREAHEYVSENFSYNYADFLLFENPIRVLRNEKIHPYVSRHSF